MAILNNCEIWHIRCDPNRPSSQFNKENPTWEVQLRTTDPQQKAEWDALGVKAKLVVHKEGTENEGMPLLTEDGKRQWRVTLRKRSLKKDGSKAAPPEVQTGGLQPLDPNTIGNGSIANVRVFQHTYGDNKIGNTLVGIQVKRLKKYTPKPREEFEADDMEYIDEDDMVDTTIVPSTTPTPSAPKTVVKLADERPETAF